jgi:hypothetical protein
MTFSSYADCDVLVFSGILFASAEIIEEPYVTKISQHIVKDAKGGWVVKRGGSSTATKYFETQQEAIEWARQVAKKQSAELYVHGTDGKIRSKYSYGHDPNPPKDNLPKD